MEDIFRNVLVCFPGYSDKTLKPGDIVLPQNVAARHKISVMQARALMDELCRNGYLEYQEATDRKVAGYHLTIDGYDFYIKKG